MYQRIVEFSYALGLSTREATVLIMAAGAGVNRKEAAHRLGCRPATVDTYWQRILHKCGMGSQLGVFAALLAFSLDSLDTDGREGASPSSDGSTTADLARYRSSIDSAINISSESRLTGDISRSRRQIAS